MGGMECLRAKVRPNVGGTRPLGSQPPRSPSPAYQMRLGEEHLQQAGRRWPNNSRKRLCATPWRQAPGQRSGNGLREVGEAYTGGPHSTPGDKPARWVW